MKLIEPINDSTLFGIGILTIYTDFASRSLLGLFWQKENREILIDILFLNIKIRIS